MAAALVVDLARRASRFHNYRMLLTIVIGFLVGVIARWIKPGARRMGWIMTTLLGVLGAVVATWLGQQLGWYAPGDRAGVLASIAGAVLVLVVYERASGPVPDARQSGA